jgi:ABC-2 type transport system permease protein
MKTKDRIVTSRLWPLFLKEFHQLRRNRRLVIMLVIPPVLNIILFGFALNPTFENLRLGIVDDSRTPESRELVSAFKESLVFQIGGYHTSRENLGRLISTGDLDAGLLIPRDFAEKRHRREPVGVQLLVDAVNANTATIAGGYAALIVSTLNQRIAATAAVTASGASASPGAAISLTQDVPRPSGSVVTRLTLLYNPGLRSAWFIATGLIGWLLVVQGSAVASAAMVREKEIGTVEQLLMTPATDAEIVFAKVAPIFLLLALDIGLALAVARIVFDIPMRGSFPLFFSAASLCVLAGVGIGMLIATFTRTQQQAQLMGFFTGPPLAILSGATTPIEAMPTWLQPVTALNPIKHFAIITRGIMLKGSDAHILYPQLLALAAIALVMVSISAWRFRKQLA